MAGAQHHHLQCRHHRLREELAVGEGAGALRRHEDAEGRDVPPPQNSMHRALFARSRCAVCTHALSVQTCHSER
eukprot:15445602-Alexandrium_andersonii.AAC.1